MGEIKDLELLQDPPGQSTAHVEKEPSCDADVGSNNPPAAASLGIQIAISKSPGRPRPWSTQGIATVLYPSPSLNESRASKDDIHIPSNNPVTPKRPNYPARGLSLQMPPRDISSTSTANLAKRVPLSPKLDLSNSYASAASVLPRRSRGLDFSRACTNLHHSTLAEQPSPDSSPVVGGRGGMSIQTRKSLFNSSSASIIPDSPGNTSHSLWQSMVSTDKTGLSSSVGSTLMMDFDSGSSSSEDDDMMGADEEENTIHMTPQVYGSGVVTMNPYNPAILASPGGDGIGGCSPIAAKLMSFQRARIKRQRSRKSSSSASGQSNMHSPGPASPPPFLKDVDGTMSGGDFYKDPMKKTLSSRRESLSLGTCDLYLSDGDQSESGGKAQISPSEQAAGTAQVAPIDERRNVIRRAVTRRGNLLPKSRNFNRIRAALLEEVAPVDTEVRREAEVIRQVRESDADSDFNIQPSQPATTSSSPSIQPATAGAPDPLEDIPEDMTMDSDLSASRRSSSSTFTQQAIKNSAGLGFWHNFDERIRTPPPTFPRENSLGFSDDATMETPSLSLQSTVSQHGGGGGGGGSRAGVASESRASTPQLPSESSQNIRKGNKRMRDDDFDPYFFKRRAVSPGLSLQNSPILPQSPLQRDGGWWGMQSKHSREAPGSQAAVGERGSSGGSSNSGNGASVPAKRVGFQGMIDTNDGLMNMSIE